VRLFNLDLRRVKGSPIVARSDQKLAMAAAIARARRSQSLLKLVLPQSSVCTYHSCGLASPRAFDSDTRSHELSLWRNYLKGLVSVRTMATFNRK
jgi:hypothetical protein